VCENQKNPKTPEKSNLAVQREREEKKNEPTIIQSHLIMMMIMCVKIRKIQKSRKIESSERERVDIPREREREIFQNRKKYYLDKLSSYVIYIYISTFKHLDRW